MRFVAANLSSAFFVSHIACFARLLACNVDDSLHNRSLCAPVRAKGPFSNSNTSSLFLANAVLLPIPDFHDICRNALGINATVTVRKLVLRRRAAKAIAGVQQIGALAAVRGKPLTAGLCRSAPTSSATTHQPPSFSFTSAYACSSPLPISFYNVNLCADTLVHEDFRGVDRLIDHNAV